MIESAREGIRAAKKFARESPFWAPEEAFIPVFAE
jgi:hypothetical protein